MGKLKEILNLLGPLDIFIHISHRSVLVHSAGVSHSSGAAISVVAEEEGSPNSIPSCILLGVIN